MPDVISRRLLMCAVGSLDVHKLSIVAATLRLSVGSRRWSDRDDRAAVRRFIERLGGREGWRSVTRPGRAGSTCCGC